MVRRGFSFIELVVTIVVIGIVFMSVPLILQETRKSTEVSVMQEAVMGGITELSNAMSYKWDENETNESLNGSYAKVLQTTQGDSELNCTLINASYWRIGHFRGSGRRKCYDPLLYASSTLGLDPDDGGIPDDIDDFNGNANLFEGTEKTNKAAGYKQAYTINLNTVYVSDAYNYSNTNVTGTLNTNAVTPSTNLKMITATITAGDKTVILRAFMANIGELNLYSKMIP